ncbi:hypothetical protein D1831_14075 [Lactiplantibacillus garii]|uniref:Uncharacterized protein n=2 Tax=Lactiplantibacillus garii TaxID=2306423 RepID=A0A426D3S2_9LACO|nr:hypothetical protein D1831_14075 [Lactiplantibacillus garii]
MQIKGLVEQVLAVKIARYPPFLKMTKFEKFLPEYEPLQTIQGIGESMVTRQISELDDIQSFCTRQQLNNDITEADSGDY